MKLTHKALLLLGGAGGGVAVDPTSIANLGIWIDPQDSSTLWQDSAGTTPAGVGDVVGRIDDKSGNGNHATQATTARKPTVNATDFGVPVLFLDGDDSLETAYAVEAENATAFCVFRLTALDAHQVVVSQTNLVIGYNHSIGAVPATQPETSQAIDSAFATSKSVLSFYTNSTGIWVNGVSQSIVSATFASALPETLIIGRRTNGLSMTGYIGELLIYDRILDAEERQSIEQYLLSKWGP